MSGSENSDQRPPTSPGKPTDPARRRADDPLDEPKSPGPPARPGTPDSTTDPLDEPKSPGPPPGSVPGESD